MEEPGRLQFKESQRVGHNWACVRTRTHTHTHTHTHTSIYLLTCMREIRIIQIKVVFSGKPKSWHITFNGMDGGGWTRITALYPKVWASPVSPWVKKKICLPCWSHRWCRFNPWVWKFPWMRTWQAIPVFCLESPMDRGAWWAVVHRVTLSQTWLKQLSTHTP